MSYADDVFGMVVERLPAAAVIDADRMRGVTGERVRATVVERLGRLRSDRDVRATLAPLGLTLRWGRERREWISVGSTFRVVQDVSIVRAADGETIVSGTGEDVTLAWVTLTLALAAAPDLLPV